MFTWDRLTDIKCLLSSVKADVDGPHLSKGHAIALTLLDAAKEVEKLVSRSQGFAISTLITLQRGIFFYF